MKRLLFRLLLLAPLGVLLVVVNYKVDPANLFSGGTYERGVAELLVRGQNVANLRNYDERLLQRLYLGALPQRRPVLVIGSSRTLLIGENLYPAGSVINAAVSGGVVEDLLATYGLYTSRGWHPDTLVIGLDPWMLNANNGQERWKTLSTEVEQTRQRLGASAETAAEGEGEGPAWLATGSTMAKLGELVSLSYFQNSIAQLRDPSKRPTKYRPTAQAVNEELTKHPDGTIAYDQAFRNADAEAGAKSYIAKKPVYSLGMYTGLAGGSCSAIEKLVIDAKQHGATVVLFLAPYHPTVWKFIAASPEYQYASRAETWFRELGQRQQAQVIGSFDPVPYQLTSSDFYDGMHCKTEVVEQLFKTTRAKHPDVSAAAADSLPPSGQ